MIITAEEPRHAAAIESLLDRAFGPHRFAKTAYRLRDGIPPLEELSLVAIDHDEDGREVLSGTIRYWPVRIGGLTPALLLGPIAVSPDLQGAGLGSKLIRMSLNKAAAAGHRAVLLVGDAPYYARFGFTRGLTERLTLPGPVDPDRFLGLELRDGALTDAAGRIEAAAWPAPAFVSVPAPSPAFPMEGFFATATDRPAASVWYARRA